MTRRDRFLALVLLTLIIPAGRGNCDEVLVSPLEKGEVEHYYPGGITEDGAAWRGRPGTQRLGTQGKDGSDFSVTVKGEGLDGSPFRGTSRIHGSPKVGDSVLGAVCLTGKHTITIRAAEHGEFAAAGDAYVGIGRPEQNDRTLDFAFTVPKSAVVPAWVRQDVAVARKQFSQSVFLRMTPDEFCDDDVLAFLGEIHLLRGEWIIVSAQRPETQRGPAIKPGDRVITGAQTPVKVGGKTIFELEAGTELKAAALNGDWVAVVVERDGGRFAGCIHAQYLTLAAPARSHTSAGLDGTEKGPMKPEGDQVGKVLHRIGKNVALVEQDGRLMISDPTGTLRQLLDAAIAETSVKKESPPGPSTGEPAEIKPGAAVTIVKDGVRLLVRSTLVAVLAKGATLVVTEVRDDWVGGYVNLDGKREYGWVKKGEVDLSR